MEGETLVILVEWAHFAEQSPSGHEKKKKNARLCHDRDCEKREVTLSPFTAVIALSITDYKCTPHGLVLFALLHHVVPSSLKLRPTRDARRNSRVPGRPLTIATECSGWFIASGSNCTYIWRSFVEINPRAGLLLPRASSQWSRHVLKHVPTWQSSVFYPLCR